MFGSTTGFDPVVDLAALDGTNGFIHRGGYHDRLGTSVSGAGDVNGDGFADVIIGSPGVSAHGVQSTGEAHVIYGRDFLDLVTQQGDTADNVLTGTAATESLIGAQGNDTLVGGGGVDVLYGGQGDDRIAVSDAAFRRIDGGAGTDTVALAEPGMVVDLTAIADNRLKGIEQFDLNSDTTSLIVSPLEVLNLSDTTNRLVVFGDADDTVQASGVWTTRGPDTIDGTDVTKYASGAAELWVETAVAVALANMSPTAQDDAFTTNEALSLSGKNVLASNGSGADIDPDGDPLTVTAIDGNAANVGTPLTVTSTGGRTGEITIAANGALTFDPMGNFPDLGPGDNDVVSIEYTITDGLATDSATATVTIEGADIALPEPNDTIPQANVSGIRPGGPSGFVATSVIGQDNDADLVRVDLRERDQITIDIDAQTIGSPLDSVLRLFDAAGNEVAVNDDDRYSFDSYLEFEALSAGTYYVGVSSFDNFYYHPFIAESGSGHSSGAYDITIDVVSGYQTIIEADFRDNSDGFVYRDDAFRGTSEPGYADGGWEYTGGTDNSPSLRVELGGINPDDIGDPGMSGGFETRFTLDQATKITLSFFYSLDMSGSYEDDEFAEVLVSLSDESTTTLLGRNGNDFVDRLVGDAGAAAPRVVSEDTITLGLGVLAAGHYTLTLGGRNNKKTTTSENTLITFDDVLLKDADFGPVFTHIEAEDYVRFYDSTSGNAGGMYRSDDVDIDTCGYAGGGYAVGWIEAGEWLEYPISVPEAGTYEVTARVASEFGGPFDLQASVNGAATTITFNGTGGWQDWTNATAAIDLDSGDQTLRLEALSSWFNLNWVEFAKAPEPPDHFEDLDGANGFIMPGFGAGISEPWGDFTGWSVSGAGDVNGDGFADMILGAPRGDGGPANTQENAGESYVIFGNGSGFNPIHDISSLDGNIGFVIAGADAYAMSGHSVSGAGDINGDGFADIMVGAPGRTAGQTMSRRILATPM